MIKTNDGIFESKFVDVIHPSALEGEELADALAALLTHLNLELVETRYYASGDPSVVRLTIAPKGSTQMGNFDE